MRVLTGLSLPAMQLLSLKRLDWKHSPWFNSTPIKSNVWTTHHSKVATTFTERCAKLEHDEIRTDTTNSMLLAAAKQWPQTTAKNLSVHVWGPATRTRRAPAQSWLGLTQDPTGCHPQSILINWIDCPRRSELMSSSVRVSQTTVS